VGSFVEKNQRSTILCMCSFKGSIQHKLRWEEIGINQWAWASDCGTGHYLVVLVDVSRIVLYLLYSHDTILAS
jgi:hypothetical protein